jgi:hypothetical protein
MFSIDKEPLEKSSFLRTFTITTLVVLSYRMHVDLSRSSSSKCTGDIQGLNGLYNHFDESLCDVWIHFPGFPARLHSFTAKL